MFVRFYGDPLVSNLIHIGPEYQPAAAAAEGEVKALVARGVQTGKILGYLEEGVTEFFGVYEARGEDGTELLGWLREFTRNRRDALERC